MLSVENLYNAVGGASWGILLRCSCRKTHLMSTTTDVVDRDEHVSWVMEQDNAYEPIYNRRHSLKCVTCAISSNIRVSHKLHPTFAGLMSFVNNMLARRQQTEVDVGPIALDMHTSSATTNILGDYLFAAQYHMPMMLKALQELSIFLLLENDCVRAHFYGRLMNCSVKIASQWAHAFFNFHIGDDCYCDELDAAKDNTTT